LKFTKIQGAGNDFILIDDRAALFSLGESEIKRLCHRHFGIGADGLILLQTDSGLRMRIFNSDGREAESCGNGLRCLGRFLLELGFAAKNRPIRVGDRTVELSYIGDKIGVDMGEPKNLCLHIATERGIVHFVDTGVPHLVHFVKDLEPLPIQELAPFWRHHPRFAPQGANVNFAAVEEGRIRVRTFERGVEGETLACGTGACAVAVVAHAVHSMPSPLLLSFAGGDLEIQIEQNRLVMVGPAIKVFEGVIEIF
jgi:diaminopimelate epimerase